MYVNGGMNESDYPELPNTAVARAAESVSLFFIMMISFVANLSIIIVVIRNHSLRRNGHNLLILNLALADFGTTVGSMFVTFLSILNNGRILQESDFLCSVNVFLSYTFFFVRFGTNNLIAIHRYLLVVQSNWLNVTLNNVYYMIATCWGLSVLFSLPSATGEITDVIFEKSIHHCRVKWEDQGNRYCWIPSLCVALTHAISVPVVIFCYTSIAIDIRNSQQKIDAFRQRVRSSISRLTGRREKDPSENNFQDLEGDLSSSIQSSTPDGSAFQSSKSTEKDKSTGGQFDQDKRKEVLIKDWNEYEEKYQEICHTLRRAGSVLNQASIITKSRYKTKSTVEMRDRTLRSVLGADKLVAFAGVLVILTSTVCWLPQSITESCIFHDKFEDLPHEVHILLRWIAYMSCTLNPLIYTMFNRSLQAALRNGYRKLKCC
ncbi:G-protein coupled receptor moody [Holothuria leucospilota]|uniref:G-protein coupled receptor moody n=1 Tax=Holothuria leucospilota TaxID=206669 RepID=A0A9Q1C8R4_HOLLE|nr:G-protein coupled receptor moody [Holothuria leucospilota]